MPAPGGLEEAILRIAWTGRQYLEDLSHAAGNSPMLRDALDRLVQAGLVEVARDERGKAFLRATPASEAVRAALD